MLAFDLKKDSWHMWVANFGNVRIGEYMKREGTDICTYTRAFLIGAALLALSVFVASVFTIWIVMGMYGLGAYLFGYIGELPAESAAFLGVIAGLLILFSGMFISEKVREYKMEKRHQARMSGLPPPAPGFLTLAYRKFKDKTCFKINFTKED